MDGRKRILLMLKAVPVVGALCCAADSMLAYFGFNLEWLGYILAITLLTAWYALARYFRFCSFYFVLLGYIITCQALNTIDYLYGIPVSDKQFFILHVALFGFYALLYTYLHVRDNKADKGHTRQLD